MRNFHYARATDLPTAVRELSSPGTALIAGGTELLNWMRLGIAQPERVIDISGVQGTDSVSMNGEDLVIGALATLNDVGENKLVQEHAAALSQACLKAASAQIRNRATLGGNVLQKTRCPYFRSEAPLPWGCNKRKPGSGCAALAGLNERHAVFGWTDACVAVHPADPPVALACLGAQALILGPRGSRMLGIAELLLSQEDVARAIGSAELKLASGTHAAQVETRLAPDELILAYRVPIVRGQRSAYIKVRERESYEYALVSAAAALTLDGERISNASVALGSVAQKPWQLRQIEAGLRGKPLQRDAIRPVLAAAASDAKPLEHNGYKVTLAINAATRALLLAGGMNA